MYTFLHPIWPKCLIIIRLFFPKDAKTLRNYLTHELALFMQPPDHLLGFLLLGCLLIVNHLFSSLLTVSLFLGFDFRSLCPPRLSLLFRLQKLSLAFFLCLSCECLCLLHVLQYGCLLLLLQHDCPCFFLLFSSLLLLSSNAGLFCINASLLFCSLCGFLLFPSLLLCGFLLFPSLLLCCLFCSLCGFLLRCCLRGLLLFKSLRLCGLFLFQSLRLCFLRRRPRSLLFLLFPGSLLLLLFQCDCFGFFFSRQGLCLCLLSCSLSSCFRLGLLLRSFCYGLLFCFDLQELCFCFLHQDILQDVTL